MKTFLKQLDPMKLYFMQSDIDEFSKREFELDDLAKEGKTEYAYSIFNVFLKRVDERVKLVDELLATEHDFTVDEEMITDRKVTAYAKNDEEIRDKWRKRIKYDLLVQKVGENRSRRRPRKSFNAAITASPSGCTRSTATSCWRCT